ncbi:MOSC domain-containing protein [Granulibacter bethesdensis]|uniref:MOSC domain-containing protein n=1 Tax=Granulibacter bethesdensis TaxID=364410 RepID=UPI00090B2819|nr:MOSC domain-containing protein [Granulibacter bethesdensis]APH59165.1 Molybdenum cofactor sulfurase [Granulibacter bethesdensis]
MKHPNGSLLHVLVGRSAPLGERQVPSAIDKRPVAGALQAYRNGFAEDDQADRRVHGGPDKALHHYPVEHYAMWRQEEGEHPLLRPGGFGENLSSLGIMEEDVALGDVFRLGGALLEVSQSRQPCWKLNARFGLGKMALRVQETGRTGWYYRVLEEGMIRAGDRFQLLERRSPAWTLQRVWNVLYVDSMNRDELSEMAALPHLPEGWQRAVLRRLEVGAVEDWSARLNG